MASVIDIDSMSSFRVKPKGRRMPPEPGGKKKNEESDHDEDNEPELTSEEKALIAFKETDKYKYLTKYELTKKDKDMCNLDKNSSDCFLQKPKFLC